MHDPFDDFDLNNPILPRTVLKHALSSGGFPYKKRIDKDEYKDLLLVLQKELVKLQSYLAESRHRVILVFEGRDAAGKGGVIKTYLEHLNPRYNINAALPKPNDRESTQWYFQRYVDWLPAAGETVLFDRSWYNRAGVEPVMGFSTPEQTTQFLAEAPHFERMLVNDGIHLFKFWLDIGREMQIKRFHERQHNPLKVWKLSPIDLEALKQWQAYSDTRDRMLDTTDTQFAPWTVVLANDKRRARLNLIRTVLNGIAYAGKNSEAIGAIDGKIVLKARDFLANHPAASRGRSG